MRNSKLDFPVPTGAQTLGFPEVLEWQNRSPGQPATSGGWEDHWRLGGESGHWATTARNLVLKNTPSEIVPHRLTVPTIFSRILEIRKIPQGLSRKRGHISAKQSQFKSRNSKYYKKWRQNSHFWLIIIFPQPNISFCFLPLCPQFCLGKRHQKILFWEKEKAYT